MDIRNFFVDGNINNNAGISVQGNLITPELSHNRITEINHQLSEWFYSDDCDNTYDGIISKRDELINKMYNKVAPIDPYFLR